MFENLLNSNKGGTYLKKNIYSWREVVLLASIFMELTWSTLWYRTLFLPGTEIGYWETYLILSGMVIGFYLVARVLNYLDISIWMRRFVLGLLIIANLVLCLVIVIEWSEHNLVEMVSSTMASFYTRDSILPIEFLVILLALFVSWRGINYPHLPTTPRDVMFRFQIGVFLFCIFAALNPAPGLIPSFTLYLFLFLGLLALSSSRISILTEMRGGKRIPFDRFWFLGMSLFILGFVGIAAMAVGLIKEPIFDFFLNIVSWVLYVLVLLLSPFMWLLMYLVLWVANFLNIDAISDLFSNLIASLGDLIQNIFGVVEEWFASSGFGDVINWLGSLSGIKPLFLWGILLLILVLILMTTRRMLSKEIRIDEDEIESLLRDDNLFSLLRSALKRGWDRFTDEIGNALRLKRAGRLLSAARIRRVYASLMRLCTKLGYARPVSVTPIEFLPKLQELFPENVHELQIITDAYVVVRYGELPESMDQIENVLTAWRTVSAAGKQKLKILKAKTGSNLSSDIS